MLTGARFSRDRRYRYALWRIWDETKDSALFIGLNPSKADETDNDPTITRCINFAKSEGFGSMYIVNLFAYCTAYPNELKKESDPIGKRNNFWITNYKRQTNCHIAIWGNDGVFLNRDKYIKRTFNQLYCLDKNKSDQPKHPLYIRANQNLRVYN